MTRAVLGSLFRWSLPWFVAIAGCTSFEAVPRSTCGNGLLEAGEDCDSKDPTCVRCAVTCAHAADCPTSDYTCGVDGFCHAPGGTLAAPISVGAFQVDDYQITDIDHDHIGDVLGVSSSSLVVRHGDAAGSLATVDSQVTPLQAGSPAISDLDLDGSLDVTIATRDGLVAYTSPFGTLSPQIVQSPIAGQGAGQLADIRMGFSITPFAFGVFIVDAGHVTLLVADFFSVSFAASLPCGAVITPADFNSAMVDTYQVSRDGDTATDVEVALVTGTGATAKLCVMAIHKDNILSLATITNITPATPPALKRKPVLADLDNDGDRCPDLVASEAGAPALRHWSGIMGAGHCTLQPAVNPNGDLLPGIIGPATVAAVGRVTIDPPSFGVAPDALVLNNGIYVLSGSGFTSIYQSTRKLNRVVNGDLNGDGASDAVLSAENQDDLDVLYRVQSIFNGFQLFRVDTSSEVTTITLDDFDGNGVKDIAYTERLSDHQRMMIVYGTKDHPLDPIAVGTFGDITSVVRASFPSSDDPLNENADLIVLQPTTPTTLSVLYGSTQRTMIPYIEPRTNVASSGRLRDNTIFRSVAVGHFAPGGGQFPDMFGIAPPAATAPTVLAVHGWLLPGTTHGIDGSASDGFQVTGVGDCSTSVTGSFCADSASFIALPVSATRDLVLGIDRAPSSHVALLDPSTSGTGPVATAAVPGITIAPNNTVRTMFVADVDGDGKQDLIATFEPSTRVIPNMPAGLGMVLVCQLTNGVPQTCVDLEPMITTLTPGTKSCLDASIGHLAFRDPNTATNAVPDLIVVCRDDGSTLYRVHREADGFHADVLTHTTARWAGVRAGDVTGDGVDDVVVLEGDKGARSLIVYPQCTSRDTVRCKLGSAAAGSQP